MTTGPLRGLRIVEMAGIGPGPFTAMMLADMGAEVIRLERSSAVDAAQRGVNPDVMLRGRRNIAVDLKNPDGVAVALDLIASADGVIEGFRPGVMERLGLGPDVCLARNAKLVFGRMTGWGQDGPYAQAAGHDINYISLAGALAHIRRAGERPVPPLNLVGDFGGGGMLLAFGMVCALFEAQRTGKGQVVDAAMVDGAALLMTMFWGFRSTGLFDIEAPGTGMLDLGAHFYDVYECKDGKYVTVGAIEPQFYALLLEKTGLTNDPDFQRQMDRNNWPALKKRLEDVMRTKTQAEWCALMETTDACFAPVLTMSEATRHPHNVHRRTFLDIDGLPQPAPAPRFSATSAADPTSAEFPGASTTAVLRDWGIDAARIASLVAAGAVKQA